MKKLSILLLIAIALLSLGACKSAEFAKQVAYFQNADEADLTGSKRPFDAHIMPKDYLQITVHALDPRASDLFNLNVQTTTGTTATSYASNSTQLYLVDNDGNIQFPVVGKIALSGLTVRQAEERIMDKIAPYFTQNAGAMVTVKMQNYVVTVTGEVANPKSITVPTEKISILEAIAQASDLTIYGRRDNVMLIREDATGAKVVHRFNLNDANVLNDPYYYLQQNDVVYVEPNEVKKGASEISTSTTYWFSLAGISTSVATLISNIWRK